MFGIGFGEMVVIGVLVLLAVGPDKIPLVAKTLARAYRQFRRAATEIRASTGIDDFLRDEELKELAELRKQKLLAMSKAPPVKPGMVDKPGVVEAPMAYGKPGAGKPGAYAHDESFAGPDTQRPGLTLKQRMIEAPPEGVDIAEARFAIRVSETVPVEPSAAPAPASKGGEASGGL